ncbi:MAG: hypothetical protein MMC33_000792 [Icmadophila ericetorum]|nr:hypothetical protein [Icmadophila ericetorum]
MAAKLFARKRLSPSQAAFYESTRFVKELDDDDPRWDPLYDPELDGPVALHPVHLIEPQMRTAAALSRVEYIKNNFRNQFVMLGLNSTNGFVVKLYKSSSNSSSNSSAPR